MLIFILPLWPRGATMTVLCWRTCKCYHCLSRRWHTTWLPGLNGCSGWRSRKVHSKAGWDRAKESLFLKTVCHTNCLLDWTFRKKKNYQSEPPHFRKHICKNPLAQKLTFHFSFMLSFIKCRSDKLQWKCRQWTWDACHELYQTVSWWPLSKSHIHPTKRSGHTRKEVLSYWRSLAALGEVAVSFLGLASDHSYKGRKIVGATGALPSSASSRAYESLLL